MAEKKKTREQLIKEAIQNLRNSQGKDTWEIVRSMYNGKNYLCVFSSEGITIYDRNNNPNIIESYKWSEINRLHVDHFALSTLFKFDINSHNWTITLMEKGKIITSLIQSKAGILVEVVQRPLWRKILGFRSKTKWKMIVASIAYFIIIAAFISSLNKDSPKSTSANSPEIKASNAVVEKTAEEKAADIYSQKIQSNICKDLMSKGLDESIAVKTYDIINQINLPVCNNKDSIMIENTNKSDYIFSYSATDGGISAIYAFHVVNGNIVEIVDEKQEVVYDGKGLNPQYVFYKQINISGLFDNAKNVISSGLKAPSTAKYPGSFLDPYEGWAISKSKDIIEVASYVDSQNSFGAMLRSNFIIKYRYSYSDGSLQPVYIKFDGKVMVNKM